MKDRKTSKHGAETRVALITGASSGIGFALAVGFAQNGVKVFATGRSRAALLSLQDKTKHAPASVEITVADLSDPAAVAKLADRAVRKMGSIDILINNAGVGSSVDPRPVGNFDNEYWNYTLAVNLTAPYLLSKAVLPHMTKKGWGRIINIASLASKMGLPYGAAYAASKHGLLGLTRTMALELASSNITVNAICPGAVRTQPNERRLAFDSKRTGKSIEEIEHAINPLGRRLVPEEIVPLALFLAGEPAGVITGQAYNVDGGACMY